MVDMVDMVDMGPWDHGNKGKGSNPTFWVQGSPRLKACGHWEGFGRCDGL